MRRECQKCMQRTQFRKRLCVRCWPRRHEYPHLMLEDMPEDTEARPASIPTMAMPGSETKIAVMMDRVQHFEQLHHDQDRKLEFQPYHERLLRILIGEIKGEVSVKMQTQIIHYTRKKLAAGEL